MREWNATIRRALAQFRRRRVFRAVVAYLIIGWLLIQVADATFEPRGLPAWSTRLLIVLLALGFVLVCALAGIYDLNPGGIERTEAEPVAPVAAPDASVAILPFTDLSEAKDQDFFCDGLAEEILNALTAVRGLRVASRTSSFRFRDSAVDAREIGRTLNVAAIMEGSVRKAGEQKTPETLDRERNKPGDLRAYEFYLRGRQLQAMKSTFTWTAAPEMFRRAIEIDPDYAQAHAGLADALVELLLWRLVRPGDVLDEAQAASQRALQLAPDLAKAHVAHANTLHLAGNYDAAFEALERGIALNNALYEGHYYFARHLFARGLHARAVDEFDTAHRSRPGEFQALTTAVGAADAIGDSARAVELATRALKLALAEAEMDPENGRARLHGRGPAVAARRQGRRPMQCRGRAATASGRFRHAVQRRLFPCERRRGRPRPGPAGSCDATGQGFRDWIEHDHDLDSLRDLPRFREIMARLD